VTCYVTHNYEQQADICYKKYYAKGIIVKFLVGKKKESGDFWVGDGVEMLCGG